MVVGGGDDGDDDDAMEETEETYVDYSNLLRKRTKRQVRNCR